MFANIGRGVELFNDVHCGTLLKIAPSVIFFLGRLIVGCDCICFASLLLE